jgi:hypothetical protein
VVASDEVAAAIVRVVNDASRAAASGIAVTALPTEADSEAMPADAGGTA